MEKFPLVSVVIPMYNSAKFISQTLESLLYQTIKNFEVVVVDDCSTDNSVEIVESFSERFGGRLNVVKLPKNNGTPGIPRNVGIQFARGKYIAFLDSDDLYTKTALEELSTLAEKFQADVVHTDTFFMLFEKNPKLDEEYLQFKNFNELLAPENLTVCQLQKLPPLNAPTFETTNLEQRINYWVNRGYNWESVTMFCKKDFLVANQINFPILLNDEDRVFSFWLLCSTEKFLRVPNITYIYRQRADSVSHKKFSDLKQHFDKWFHVLRDGINEFERIMASIDFFSKRPDYRYAVLQFFANGQLPKLSPYNLRIPEFSLNELFKQEFHPTDASLAAYMFNTLNIYRMQLARSNQENVALKNELKKYQLARVQ
ncbi:MAG: glycosyltransferase family 2 protein [Selenomonadaceae bacterium]|nr:glycosyltransferase family 2 protein [Selenomonadaceae bacterium]